MEIYMSLRLSPSTVSYIIRKFSRRGVLVVEKRRGRYNYVKLSQNIGNILNIVRQLTQEQDNPNKKEKSNIEENEKTRRPT